MLKNHFRVALRNLRKNKSFSLINIAGLSVGIAAFLLIALFVLDERASVAHLMLLSSGDFARPILWALLIASPVAFWLGSRWLTTFAY